MSHRMATLMLSAVTVLCLSTWQASSVEAQDAVPSFDEFIVGVRTEALANGISQATLDRALTGLMPQSVVVARDRTQPEVVQSVDRYLTQRLTTRTVTMARQMHTRHTAILRRVEERYGVPGTVMTAIWGLESSFGRFTGTYPTVRALATLAYDNRRPLFRSELLSSLAMIDAGVPIERMMGSWAGAMGQPQFMPSSFLKHAVDQDGDGAIDIWSSLPDVFGSMANYLKNAGWTPGQRWGREVTVTREALSSIDRDIPMQSGGCRALRSMTEPRRLEEWTRLGVRLPGGAALPVADVHASLVRGEQRYFLAYSNYLALLDYNCSHSYALSVALLSDRVSR